MTVERHLVLQELTLHPSGEWTPPTQGWTVLRVVEGAGYWLQGGSARELNSGDGFVCSSRANFVLRASSLGVLRVEFYGVQPQFLNGLLTVAETHRLEQTETISTAQYFLFSASDAIGQKFKHLVAQPNRDALPVRSGLLQLWSQAIASAMAVPANHPDQNQKLRERFREIIGKMPDAELATRSLTELAERVNCSERHFSRLFSEEYGVSLRSRQTELRLLRARQLLEDVNSKIINVAYESGYRHLGLFNSMFKRRFGVTPREWRQKNALTKNKSSVRISALLAWLIFSAQLFFAPVSLAMTADNPDQAAARAALVQKLFELSANEAEGKTNSMVTANVAPPEKLVEASPEVISAGNAKRSAATNVTTESTFKVEKYLVAGNSILPASELERILLSVPEAFGTNVAFSNIRGLLGELQMAYRERGFVTVNVGLPPQKLTNDMVKIKVTEGRLANVTVKGNKYYSTENVLRALPSLHSNMMLNSHVFQSELDAANANRDRQIYPVIGPGVEPGTSELTLKVKDRFPIHGRVEINNAATPGTPDSRINANMQYGNLWDLEHQIGIAYGFTPVNFSSGHNYYFSPVDLPQIANYSGYYRLPLSHTQSIQHQIDNSNGQFGYNEVTHKFMMPPPSGHPDLMVYASRSISDTGIQLGALKNVVNTPLLAIDSQDSGQSVTLNENAGAKISWPLPTWDKVATTVFLGMDFKRYNQTSYNTNNFYATTVITNSSGTQTIRQTVASPQPTRYSAVEYFPLNFGFTSSRPDKYGSSSFNFQGNLNVATIGSLSKLAYSAGISPIIISNNITHKLTTNGVEQARDNYLTLQAGYSREQRLYHDWTVLLHADGQWSSTPLFSNERFGMGGTAGVRGFTDGSSYGDAGWRASIEPRTPLVNVGMVDGDLPMWMRGSVFWDYGQLYAFSKALGVPGQITFMGAGFAITASIGSHIDARASVAWPIESPFPKSSASSFGGNGMHFYFGAGAQF